MKETKYEPIDQFQQRKLKAFFETCEAHADSLTDNAASFYENTKARWMEYGDRIIMTEGQWAFVDSILEEFGPVKKNGSKVNASMNSLANDLHAAIMNVLKRHGKVG